MTTTMWENNMKVSLDLKMISKAFSDAGRRIVDEQIPKLTALRV